MSIPVDPTIAHTLEVLALTHRQLDDAVGRLADAAGRAARLAGETTWRTDAAAPFHLAAEQWRRNVGALSGAVEQERDEIARLRMRIEAQAGSWGL